MLKNDEIDAKFMGEKDRLTRKRKKPDVGLEPQKAIAITPLYEARGARDIEKFNRRMKNRVLDAFNSGTVKKLEQELPKYALDDSTIRGFFQEWGRLLFNRALLLTDTPEALWFLKRNIPHQLLLEVLQKDEYSVVEKFLLLGSEDIPSELPKEAEIATQKEKFKILFAIDPSLKELMETPSFQDKMADNIFMKTAFQNALDESSLRSGISKPNPMFSKASLALSLKPSPSQSSSSADLEETPKRPSKRKRKRR